MKIILTILSLLLTVSTTYAAGKITCTPTISTSVGKVNYDTQGDGLNRISEIVVTEGKLSNGGYGIVLNLKGTGGTGDQKAEATHNLAWAAVYGSELVEYNNAKSAKSTLANPYIRFELENMAEGSSFLGALTFSSSKDLKGRRLLTSRYNCSVESNNQKPFVSAEEEFH